MEKHTVDPLMIRLFEFRPRKGDLKKAEIITAAIECLSEEGLEKTTFEAIAKRIGTRRAHVNYYFSDKQKIFLAAIQYIAATYQSISLECLENAHSNEDLLDSYLQGPFKWAKNHPEQLSVMFLLYYLSTFQKEYLELNHQIRKGGAQRISYILRKRDETLTKKDADQKAKSIQNILSGCLLDVATTKGRTLASAEKEVKRLVELV
ncbi:MAG: AcrR family transcriptional regulator [Bacteriovoracaceae bacterium]|jgi:AcrR family transcriptional regulator